MAAPDLAHMGSSSAPVTDMTDDASPSNNNPGSMDTIDEVSPSNEDPSLMDTAEDAAPSNDNPSSMYTTDEVSSSNSDHSFTDTTDDTAPSNDNPGSMDITGDGSVGTTDKSSPSNGHPISMDPLPSSPASVSDLQGINSTVSPASETGTMGHSPGSAGSGGASEVSPRINLGPDLPSNLSISSPRDTPASPCSNMPTPTTTLIRPPLMSAEKNVFNMTGILRDFISEYTLAYWESVPGGEKWVAMVRSYLRLQTMSPFKQVSNSTHLLSFMAD